MENTVSFQAGQRVKATGRLKFSGVEIEPGHTGTVVQPFWSKTYLVVRWDGVKPLFMSRYQGEIDRIKPVE